MSLEAVIESNTAAIRALIATLQAGAPIAVAAAPGVAQLDAARAALDAQDSGEKQQTPAATASAAAAGTAPTPESSKPGAASASTPTSSNDAQPPVELKPWHEKTAALYAELKDAPITLETCKKTILAVNANISREQAVALLSRFGAEVVAPKPGKKHLDESLFGDYMALALKILAGHADATEAQFQPE